jgi:hypothetical protein
LLYTKLLCFFFLRLKVHLAKTVAVTKAETATEVAANSVKSEHIMGFRKPMDYNDVYHQIYMTGVEIMSSRNDGFTQFDLKCDLYQLKSLIDVIIENSPKFSGEDEWLANREKEKIIRILEK